MNVHQKYIQDHIEETTSVEKKTPPMTKQIAMMSVCNLFKKMLNEVIFEACEI